MMRLSYTLGTNVALVLILLFGMACPAFAAGNQTTTGSLELVPTFECISVYANFSGDDNGNNTAVLHYRTPAGSGDWIPGMLLTVDRRAQIYSDTVLVDNPFQDQWRGSILGCTPNTEYEVRVTLSLIHI